MTKGFYSLFEFESRVVFFFIGVGFIGIFLSASFAAFGSVSNAMKLVACDDYVVFLSLEFREEGYYMLLNVFRVFEVLYELLVVARFFSLFWFPKLD